MKLIFKSLNEKNVEEAIYETKDNFVEELFVQISDSLGLTKPTNKESANTLDGLRLRRLRRLTDSQTKAVLDSSSLTDRQRDILYLLSENRIHLFGGKNIFDTLLSFDCECLSDLREWFEGMASSNFKNEDLINVFKF